MRWAKNEKFHHHGDSQKNLMGGGGGHEKPINRGELPKKGLGQFVDLRGAWQKRGRGCF